MSEFLVDVVYVVITIVLIAGFVAWLYVAAGSGRAASRHHHPAVSLGRTAYLKGFGCRPEHERSIRYKAGVRKPRKKEPAGKR